MATVTQKVFVHYDTSKWCEYVGWSRYDLKRYQSDGETGDLFICEAEVTFEVPDNFDPRPQQVKALEEKRTQLQARFAAAVTEINRQISQLQAIEHTEAA